MNSKSKAIHKTVKAIGGKLTFMTKEHPVMKKHLEHEKLLESRKERYNAWQHSLGKNK